MQRIFLIAGVLLPLTSAFCEEAKLPDLAPFVRAMLPAGSEPGKTMVSEVVGNGAGSFLDSKLAVLDENGKELQFNDDWYVGGDPHLAFTAPKAADYIVQISHAFDLGNKDFSYRLIAGAYPYVDRSLPAAVERAATTEVELSG